MEKLSDERLMVAIPDHEIMVLRDGLNARHLFVLRRIERAIHTERTRPWREVLGTDQE